MARGGDTVSAMRYETLPNGTRLGQDDRFLKLGTDAILLAAACPNASSAVDLGCGVGNVLLSIADRQPNCSLVGVELNPDAAAVCRQSVAENSLEHRVRVVDGDLRALVGVCSPLRISPHSFDLVVCNPPYLRDGSGKLSQNTARNLERFDTTASPLDVTTAAAALLRPNGTLMLVLRPDRLDDYLAAAEATGFAARAICHVSHTAGARPSIVLLQAEYRGEAAAVERTELLLSEKYQDILEGKSICLRSTSSRPR